MDNQETTEAPNVNQSVEIRRQNSEIDRILNISLPSITAQRQTSNNEGRYCWVCFATDEEDLEAGGVVEWIKPCKCKGTLQHVHQSVSWRLCQHHLKYSLTFFFTKFFSVSSDGLTRSRKEIHSDACNVNSVKLNTS